MNHENSMFVVIREAEVSRGKHGWMVGLAEGSCVAFFLEEGKCGIAHAS
jgi:hypothetical protein